jgi:hypothetical protein
MAADSGASSVESEPAATEAPERMVDTTMDDGMHEFER